MKIAVAGSEGFLGRNVCFQLEKEGHEIIPLDVTKGIDMCDSAIIEQVPQVDCFIHLANLVYVPDSYANPAKFYRVNYLTTLNALEICRKWNARLVYISSYIYGAPQYLPVDEAHPVSAFNPYAQTKVICEKLCMGYHRDFGVKVSIMRPFNIYGVGQKGKLLIPEIISQLKEGKKFVQLKAATPRRDYISVVDVARAIVVCSKITVPFGTYNVCSGESVSVREITEVINRHLKNKVEFGFAASDRPNEVDETRGSCEKLKGLGWQPSVTFEQGIIDILNSENL